MVRQCKYHKEENRFSAIAYGGLLLNEVIDESSYDNYYRYYNDLSIYNNPVIFNINKDKNIISSFCEMMSLCTSTLEKVYTYMNSAFRTFISIEEFINLEIKKEDIIKEFKFFRFFGKVHSIGERYIEISPLFIRSKNTIRIDKSKESDDEWKNININDEVSYDLKSIIDEKITGKTLKLVKEHSDLNLITKWEIYSRSLLMVSLSKYISEDNRDILEGIKNIDFRAIRKISKNQELIVECIESLISAKDIVKLLEILGDKNSFKYDEVRTKLCYKPNNKENEKRIENLLEKVVNGDITAEEKVYIYMNSPLKTAVSIDIFLKKLLESGIKGADVYKLFEKYKFYGKIIYSTGNILKFQPLSMYLKDIITVDKRSQSSIKKKNVNLNNVIIFKIRKYYEDTRSIDVQVLAQIVRK